MPAPVARLSAPPPRELTDALENLLALEQSVKHAMVQIDEARMWSDHCTGTGIRANVRDAIARNGERGRPAARRIDRVNRTVR